MAIPPFIGFDLGDTLVEYAGVPLNWEAHYAEALHRLAGAAGFRPTTAQLQSAVEVLRTYNTRLNPRTVEVTFAEIAADIWRVWGLAESLPELTAAEAFFGPFQRRLHAFPDAMPTLTGLAARNVRIAVFTDVPYGMPRALVERDLELAGLAPLLDVVVTSRDTGHRKPSPAALAGVAKALGVEPAELSYVGNEPKDIAAARAFGCRGILIDRAGHAPRWAQDRTIRSLLELLT